MSEIYDIEDNMLCWRCKNASLDAGRKYYGISRSIPKRPGCQLCSKSSIVEDYDIPDPSMPINEEGCKFVDLGYDIRDIEKKKCMSLEFGDCNNKPEWEVWFTQMDWNSDWEGPEFGVYVCDRCFESMAGCGNGERFREINTKKWYIFMDWDCAFRDFIQEKNIRKYLEQRKEYYGW